jgi:Flp pilus assembly protein TadG
MNKKTPRSQPSPLESFWRSEGGNTGMMFGLTILMLMTGVGVAIDYSSQSGHVTRMLSAAAKPPGLDFAARRKIAEREYFANLAAQGVSAAAAGTVDIVPEGKSGVRVTGHRTVENAFMGLVGRPTSAIKATSVANAAGIGSDIEVALVLDNTGSMINDMSALREAASQLADTLFQAAPTPGAVRMALVPFTASVNVGRNNISMTQMDTGANGLHHARWLRDRYVAPAPGCNWGPAGPWTGWPDPGPGKGGAELGRPFQNFADAARELMGISPAHAQSVVTPNTNLATATGTTVTLSPPTVSAPVSLFIPTGFSNSGHPCWLMNPAKVSHFDLFNRIPGARWKGCVEARPEPHDVEDTAPNGADANTLFVPYFWPDEQDPAPPNEVHSTGFNNYMSDGPVPSGWSPQRGYWEKAQTLLKYNSTSVATINETGPTTSGPNKSCGQELTPLTADKATILAEISKMKHWNDGGTITSEGLMWGWRALSPEPPLTQGKPYGKAKKYIILMTDGENMVGAQDPQGPTLTDYSAYGFLRFGRFPQENYASMYGILDQRMEQACANVKKVDVTVITVLFRVTDTAVINRMRNCASLPPLFYHATDGAGLKNAFQAIAQDMVKLRLVR